MIKNSTTYKNFNSQTKSVLTKLALGGIVAVLAISVVTLALQVKANAETIAYSNGFETNTDGWFDGTVTRTASNPGGIIASEGGYYAEITGKPHTKLGGYNSSWPGDWSTSIDVYLDPPGQ